MSSSATTPSRESAVAFHREIEARRRPERASGACGGNAGARYVFHRCPAQGQVAVGEGGAQLQPGQAHAVVDQRVHPEQDIRVDIGETGPRVSAGGLRSRLRRILRPVGLVAGCSQIGVDVDRVGCEGSGDARPLARCDGRVADDPRGIDPDVEVGRRQLVAAGGEVAARAENTQPVRRDIAHVHAEPGEDRAQIVRRDLGRTVEPWAVLAPHHAAGELDLGATGKQRRSLLDCDGALGQRKLRSGPDELRPRAR